MVNIRREGLGLLIKLGIDILGKADTTEEPKIVEKPVPLSTENSVAEPMKAFWDTDKQAYIKDNQPFVDPYQNGAGLDRIPDVTDVPVKESHYRFEQLFRYPDAVKNLNLINGVPETPKAGTGISSSGRDAGVVAGIVIAVISGIIILAGLIAVVMYKHYVHRNVTSMNFDNPVYRKTTEDQFALEKNGYAPGSKLYPSTVGEEAQEPLNTPGTNEFV